MKQTERDSKKRIAFPIQLFAEGSADAQIPSEIHVVPTGKWHHPAYGEMEITSDDIAQFVKNFNDKVRLKIPITAGHDNGMSGGELPAIGWFTDLIDRGVNGLWAGVQWTEEGMRLLRERAFRYFSPEFYQDYEDPETRRKFGHVLVGGALTNKPYFKELEPAIAFSEPAIIHQFTDIMDLNTILSKKPEELSAEEQGFLREHQSDLTDEQKTAFASALADSGESDEGEEGAGDEDGSGDGENGNGNGESGGNGEGDGEGQRTAREPKGKKIVMSEAEVRALQEKANAGQRALEKIEASERKALVERLTFSEKNESGRFYPKQQKALENFLKTLSEPQRDAFNQLVHNMPTPDKAIFSEIGDGSSNEQGIFAEVDAKVQDAIKASEGKLNYADALRKVFTENPDLHKRYSEARSEDAE